MKLKNEFPKRIIRVDGCHECDRKMQVHLGTEYNCLDKRMEYMNITKYVKNKYMPYNCPLEKVVQIITEK